MKKVTINNVIINYLDNFSRSYDFNSEPYSENINLTVQIENVDALVDLQKSKITDIVIRDGEDDIYSIHNLDGKITYINESINNNNRKMTNIQIKVNHEVDE